MPTVTVSSTAPERVAVIVKDDPAFSAIDVALVVSVTVGARFPFCVAVISLP